MTGDQKDILGKDHYTHRFPFMVNKALLIDLIEVDNEELREIRICKEKNGCVYSESLPKRSITGKGPIYGYCSPLLDAGATICAIESVEYIRTEKALKSIRASEKEIPHTLRNQKSGFISTSEGRLLI